MTARQKATSGMVTVLLVSFAAVLWYLTGLGIYGSIKGIFETNKISEANAAELAKIGSDMFYDDEQALRVANALAHGHTRMSEVDMGIYRMRVAIACGDAAMAKPGEVSPWAQRTGGENLILTESAAKQLHLNAAKINRIMIDNHVWSVDCMGVDMSLLGSPGWSLGIGKFMLLAVAGVIGGVGLRRVTRNFSLVPPPSYGART